jgi:copper(I)-binding protein
MRFQSIIALAALALTLGACGSITSSSAPAGIAVGPLQIADVWARQAGPMPDSMGDAKPTAAMGDAKPAAGAMAAGEGGDAVGAVYLTIRNSAGAPDRLLKASSAIAKNVELHTMIKNGDVMEMRQVEAIDVPANGEVALKPGSFHVMLIGLNKELKPGDTFDVTLQFAQAGSVTVQASVRPM